MLSPRHLAAFDPVRLGPLDLPARIAAILGDGSARAVFTTSLGREDQAITAAIALLAAPVTVVTLQTGRLFPETEALIAETRRRYGLRILELTPDPADEADYVRRYGRDGFYHSLEARHACCGFRKLAGLRRALAGADIWITGLRRGQSDARGSVPFSARDREHNLLKVNPVADWDGATLDRFLAEHDVPVNPLHARNYPSIGCAPCTRAVRPGEPERAGRWWWERDDRRECGLHPGGPAAAAVGETARV